MGPSSGTTGKARACQVHAANNGRSVAKGHNCTPTPPPTTATITVTTDPSTCVSTITGTGLMAGSQLSFSYEGSTDVYPLNIFVDAGGNVSATTGGGGPVATLHATTALGAAITAHWVACGI